MVKIDLITGFLGSGKTTFIKKYARYLLCLLYTSVIPVPSIFPEYSERKQVSHQLSGRKTGTVCRKIDTSF